MNFEKEMISLSIFFVIALSLSIVFLILTAFLSNSNNNKEKLTSYECGFEPFGGNKGCLDIHFLPMAILFLIFDLEVVMLFPWAINLRSLGFVGFWSFFYFFFSLTIGFMYEWSKNIISWPYKFNKL